ncbi:Hypothetical methyltransferase [Candidatus Burarchaeum australiense]|nr:Hypothetical methyltransferase [Candidatus Burarchaeum australiense]
MNNQRKVVVRAPANPAFSVNRAFTRLHEDAAVVLPLSRENRHLIRTYVNEHPDKQELIARFWKGLSFEESAIPESMRQMIQTKVIESAEKLKLRGGKGVIIDLGCWDGKLIAFLRERHFMAFGVDLVRHPDMPEKNFIEGSAEEIPRKDNSVCLFIDSFTTQFTDLDASVGEIFRALTPGGRTIVVHHHLEKVRVFLKEQSIPLEEKLRDLKEKGETDLPLPLLNLFANSFENKKAAVDFYKSKGFRVLEIWAAIDHTTETCLAFLVVLEKPAA